MQDTLASPTQVFLAGQRLHRAGGSAPRVCSRGCCAGYSQMLVVLRPSIGSHMHGEFGPEDAKRFYDRFGRLQDAQIYEWTNGMDAPTPNGISRAKVGAQSNHLTERERPP